MEPKDGKKNLFRDLLNINSMKNNLKIFIQLSMNPINDFSSYREKNYNFY